MQYVEIKRDIYIALLLLGLILLVIAFRLVPVAFNTDLTATLLFLISMVQGSVCLGFGAFTLWFHEDPEIWQ
ncbi:MAG: hypothetical protein IT342_16990 [Candidatus Melainabacteria bacterium]|nr:hypothetical protein [Candidatus Melainabacteria bacterium]